LSITPTSGQKAIFRGGLIYNQCVFFGIALSINRSSNCVRNAEGMEMLSVECYKKRKLRELHDLKNKSTSWSELGFVLNDSWFKRVRAVINSWDNQMKIDDGAYNLFRIFLDDSLDPAVLNSRLVKVEAVSREQKRLRAYRKSRGELASVQTNQIHGSIFEVNIVYAALQTCSSVEVFPKAGEGGSDVEAKVLIDNRFIFIEAKALTYSKNDLGARYDSRSRSHSIDSMIKQIHDALSEKLAQGKQLHLLSKEFPTVLFLALGFNADKISAPWGIESFYQKCRSNVSAVVLLESTFCRNLVKVFDNKNSTFPLSQKERNVFENAFCRSIKNNDDR